MIYFLFLQNDKIKRTKYTNTLKFSKLKGLYEKARSGEIPNFSDIESPYEASLKPDIHIKTKHHSVSVIVEQLL